MKFKMSQNSLFAVLLRSPWWVSMVAAAALAALAAALMPEKYKLVGALSATPLLVVGLMAARRQWRLPSAARVDQTAAAVAALAWPAFQQLLTQGFERDGYTVSPSGSPAFDLLLQRQGRSTLVLARRWKSARVGLEPLRALQAERAQRDAGSAMVISLAPPSDSAWPFVRQHGITVCQAPELAQLLRGLPLTPPASPQKARPAR